MIGLGRMGGNMVERLMRHSHQCVVYDLSPANVQNYVAKGAAGSASLEEFVKKLSKPRAAWVMVPAGPPTENTVLSLAKLMEPGDIIIDGGNSYFKDDVRRARELKPKGIHYVDVGTSGGVWGLQRGYCLMIGGDSETVKRLDPIFSALAPGLGDIERTESRDKLDPRAERGYIHAGPAGAGHFVKMIHNGIEHGMMQAFAEGFDILKNRASAKLPAHERFDLNLAELAKALEDRGFDSLFVPEHTHIPLSRNSPFPGGGELPKRYSHAHDPFVALSFAAAATKRLKVGTGILLVPQHEPIATAK